MKTWSLLATVSLFFFSAEDNQAEYRKEQKLNHTVFPPKDTKGLILQGSESFICQMEWKVWMLRKHHPEGLAAVLPVMSISELKIASSSMELWWLTHLVCSVPPVVTSQGVVIGCATSSACVPSAFFKVQVTGHNMGAQVSDNPWRSTHYIICPQGLICSDLSLIFSFKELMWPMVVECGITCNYFNWAAPLYLLCTFRI